MNIKFKMECPIFVKEFKANSNIYSKWYAWFGCYYELMQPIRFHHNFHAVSFRLHCLLEGWKADYFIYRQTDNYELWISPVVFCVCAGSFHLFLYFSLILLFWTWHSFHVCAVRTIVFRVGINLCSSLIMNMTCIKNRLFWSFSIFLDILKSIYKAPRWIWIYYNPQGVVDIP